MASKALETFYLFFQSVLVFQVLFFVVLYFVTRRKDMLYYSFFLFFAAAYFFINAPYTFFGIPEDIVWNSAWYDYINTPVIIVENLFYLLFLKFFFVDVTEDKTVNRILHFVLWLIPFIFLLFVVFTLLQMDKQFIFYTVKLIAIIPSITIVYVLLKRKPPFAVIVAKGLLCTIAGTCITVFMIILRNQGIHHLFTDGYPLFFIRLGLLGDMIFYLAAILKKWHFQEKQLALEKLQSQLADEKLRNKISGELHDDFGSTLSGLSMFSYLINDYLDSGRYSQAKESVLIIQKSANEMTDNLSDLVWAIRPDQDSLEKLMEKLKEYIMVMAAAKNIETSVNLKIRSEDISLPVETRRNIYLFCKEAINNAVKYSQATILELHVKELDGILEFSILDNGNGFNVSLVKKGNGLVNMQKRAEAIGSKLVLESKENQGTSVSLQCKIT
ncbi:MAG: 7TM diverse intracellular signaling domain-containing protein [Ferruginibacter sp.]